MTWLNVGCGVNRAERPWVNDYEMWDANISATVATVAVQMVTGGRQDHSRDE